MSFEDRYQKRCRGHWDVNLHHWDVRDTECESDTAKDAVFKELTRRGIDARVADSLVRSHPTTHIEEKLQFHDSLLSRCDKRCSKNPAGFLVEAIRRDFRERPGFEAEKKARPKAATKALEAEASAVEVDARRALFERFWNALSAAEQSTLETKAVETGNRFQVETYRRLQGSGSQLFEQVRLQLIRDFVESQDLLPREASESQHTSVVNES
jgi:hypothetical protein